MQHTYTSDRYGHFIVSILTRPESRVQLTGYKADDRRRNVSILTRPESRVQRLGIAVVVLNRCDVSILTRPESRVQRATERPFVCPSLQFQSSPGPKAGCNQDFQARDRISPPFQSSPGPKTGCNRGLGCNPFPRQFVSILTRPESRVQPKLSFGFPATRLMFNPHPARKPGATPMIFAPAAPCSKVSILTRPESRVQRRANTSIKN